MRIYDEANRQQVIFAQKQSLILEQLHQLEISNKIKEMEIERKQIQYE